MGRSVTPLTRENVVQTRHVVGVGITAQQVHTRRAIPENGLPKPFPALCRRRRQDKATVVTRTRGRSSTDSAHGTTRDQTREHRRCVSDRSMPAVWPRRMAGLELCADLLHVMAAMTISGPLPAPHDPPRRPRLRGRLHQAAFCASLGGLAALVLVAHSTLALVAAAIYGCATAALYFVSFSYHVLARGPRARRIMQRADHSMIFVFIAGSFTPVVLLALHGPWRWGLLGAVWTIALGGVALKCLALERFPRLGGGLYIALGWAGVFAAPAFAPTPSRPPVPPRRDPVHRRRRALREPPTPAQPSLVRLPRGLAHLRRRGRRADVRRQLHPRA
jgi:channel protein (hemolysin III family)